MGTSLFSGGRDDEEETLWNHDARLATPHQNRISITFGGAVVNLVKGNAIGNHLLHKTLAPCANKGTVYLKEAYRGIYERGTPEQANTRKEKRECAVIGIFSFPELCYIDEIGHFNAVEFVICYNQIMYVSLAHAVENGLLESFIENLDEFYRKQLPDMYISKLESHYKSPINVRKFEGIIRITRSKKIHRTMYLKIEIGFSDNSSGFAYGSVDLAIVGV